MKITERHAIETLSDPKRADAEQPWNTEIHLARSGWMVTFAAHQLLRLDPEAINVRHTYALHPQRRQSRSWRVNNKMLLDEKKKENDWVAEFDIDLKKSRGKPGMPFVRLMKIGRLT